MDTNVRVLYFQNYQHLSYWFIKILEYLRAAYPELIWKYKRNHIIYFGTQTWTFMVYDKLKLTGRKELYPMYLNSEYYLEQDFENTMIKILKGEVDDTSKK